MEQRESHEMQNIREETRQANAAAPKTAETTHEPRFLSRASSMTVREPVIRTLHTSLWPLMVYIFYATIALFTWIALCFATTRPIGSKQDFMHQTGWNLDLDSVLAKHERALRAAQILQSVVALLTIPITSSICSMALAAYIQAGSSRTKLNLRQTMALVDQGWISPRIWAMRSKVGSLPLYLAFGLTLVGAVFPIMQQTVVQVTTIRIPTRYGGGSLTNIPDIPALIGSEEYPVNRAVVRLRSILESRTAREFEPYLWTDEPDDTKCFETWSAYSNCNGFARSLYQLDEATSDVWFSPVASDFNTGVSAEPQYAPRINTSITYTEVTSDGWPSECERDRGDVFFTEYHYAIEDRNFGVDVMACMPTNISDTPWQATYDRQEITEDLFFALAAPRSFAEPVIYRVTARSTLGYFELPNAKNGNRAGPLLDKLSWSTETRSFSTRGVSDRTEKRATNETYVGDATQDVGTHIGPLTALGLALFGEGSFIERRVSNPSAFVLDRALADSGYWSVVGRNCVANMPFGFAQGYGRDGCLSERDQTDEIDVIYTVAELVTFLAQGGRQVKSAFTVAAFLANKEWLSPGLRDYSRETRLVDFDPGVPVKKTTVPFWAVITGSVFLGLHLLGLLVLAIYAVYARPIMLWLGAELMVKAGTVHADILSAAEGNKQWKQTMAACPGFVGDERPTDDVGRIAFGATASLSRKQDKKFEEL